MQMQKVDLNGHPWYLIRTTRARPILPFSLTFCMFTDCICPAPAACTMVPLRHGLRLMECTNIELIMLQSHKVGVPPVPILVFFMSLTTEMLRMITAQLAFNCVGRKKWKSSTNKTRVHPFNEVLLAPIVHTLHAMRLNLCLGRPTLKHRCKTSTNTCSSRFAQLVQFHNRFPRSDV